MICRHGRVKIQIKDQGREFVNEVRSKLHKMTGVNQCVTSAYHPQTNGLCERQNRLIKDSLIKVLNGKPEEWPYVIDGVLFAHRVNIHKSTKYSPFYLMYNRHPILAIDVKYDLECNGGRAEDESPFSMGKFDAVLSSTLSLREETHKAAREIITKAQERQKRDYDRRHKFPSSFKVNSKVWLKNQKRIDKKSGKFSYKWTGPYEIQYVSKKGKIYIYIFIYLLQGCYSCWKNIFGARHKVFSVQIHYHPLRHII